MDRKGIKEYIYEQIIPQYHAFDSAHREDHALSVMNQAIKLAEDRAASDADIDMDMLLTAAACHDLGLVNGRENHHLDSGAIIRSDHNLKKWFSEEQIETIAQAAEDHRASGKSVPRSIYGMIVAEADRVIDAETIIQRTIRFGMDRYPELNAEGHMERALAHLKEKYGRGGYLKLWIPWSDNSVKLSYLQDLIEDESAIKEEIRIVYSMENSTDPMGRAIYDYHNGGCADTLVVHSPMFEDDEIPVNMLFREFDEMPHLEQTALEMAKGRILDVGAAAGCHSLALQKMGKTSVAIDISPFSVKVMKQRGLDARMKDFYDKDFNETFDTILLLMNGTGIIGTIDNVPSFFARLKQILNPGGCVLLDSSDLCYLFEEEDGSVMMDLAADYYGQLVYQMEYKGIKGEVFDWLYLDFDTLAFFAEENGFTAECVAEGEHYDYLAILRPAE